MKIVMLCDLYVDSLQYRENLLARYYAKHGHAVTVVASTFEGAFDFYSDRHDATSPGRQYHDGAVRVIKRPYSLNLLHRLRRLKGVAKILEEEAPDFIFVHDLHLNLEEAVQYRRRHPKSRLVMCTGMDATNSANSWLSRHILHGQIRRRLFDRWRPFLDKLYVAVPIAASFLHDVYGVPEQEMDLLPLCADTDLAAEILASTARRDVREKLGFKEGQLVVFTGGKLAALKQTHMVVEAIQQLRDERVGLVLVGDAEHGQEAYRDELRRTAEGNPDIHFMGWLKATDVYAYMGACDVAAFPASQSVLWQQALSMGLPLIIGRATWRGDQDPSYMNPYDNLIMIPRADITSETIANHLRALARDPERLARMRDGALRVSNELLNYNRIVEKTFSDTGAGVS